VLPAAYRRRKLAYALPPKDGGTLRTIDDALAYMLKLPKARELRRHWQRACEMILAQATPAAVTGQLDLALFPDGQLAVAALDQIDLQAPPLRPTLLRPKPKRYFAVKAQTAIHDPHSSKRQSRAVGYGR
jgi:hypothetical protein